MNINVSFKPDDIVTKDGQLIQRVVRQGLVAMLVAIFLLSGAALWAILELAGFYMDELHSIEEQEKLLHTMRLSARERTLLLYSMVSEKDPFERDRQKMELFNAGAEYANARMQLSEILLHTDDYALLLEQGKLTAIARPAQEEVIELIVHDQTSRALELLNHKVVPVQLKVMEILDELNNRLEKSYEAVHARAEMISRNTIAVLAVSVIFIIAGVFYIVRQTTFRSFRLITRLTQTHSELQKAHNELQQQKDALDYHAIVSIADQKGDMIYVNDKFCEISGYDREELLGKNHRIVRSDVHSDEFFRELWRTIARGQVWQGRFCNRKKDGGRYWVESSIIPFLNNKGKPYQYVSIRTDITELIEAKIAAEKASNAKDTFLSVMSHELRTPMNAVLGFTQLLEVELEGAQLDAVHEIKAAAKHLMVIINEILDLSKIDADQVSLQLENVHITPVVYECVHLVQRSANSKNISIEYDSAEHQDTMVFVDRTRLKQALLNYMSNAIKYNSKDGTVQIRILPEGTEKYRIMVSDSGPGLTREECYEVFQPFYRLEQHVNLVEGTGIGLTITRSLVEKMNGSVGVESEPGKGSTFWMVLPAAVHE